MNNNTVKITVTDNRGDLVLATTSETYTEDLQNNKDKLNIWWRCNVEYDNGKVGYDYPCNHNGKKPRKVIFVNGRQIYADYNFSIEGVENVCDTLKEMFDIDFKSNEQPKELFEQDKAYKNYMRHNYSSKQTVTFDEYPDDLEVSNFQEVPSYKRMCICILKNDYYCKYMGFSQTKQEQEKRRKALEKYKNL